jgi:hypothetical protein
MVDRGEGRLSNGGLGTISLLLALATGGCKAPPSSTPTRPTITDATGLWTEDLSTRRFSAQIEITEPYALDSVEVRFTRHYPEDLFDALAYEEPWLTATEVAGEPGLYRVSPPNPALFEQNDAVRYQWVLRYTVSGNQNIEDTQPQRLVVGHTLEDEEKRLLSEQASVVARFDFTDPHLQLVVGGVPILPHGYASLENTGVAFANTSLGTMSATFAGPLGANISIPVPNRSLAPALGQPAVLFYAPRPQKENESDEEYFALITDLAPDPPYTLVGWNYGSLYDPTLRPQLDGFGSDRWMVHEAGWHMADGSMQLLFSEETVLGQANPAPPSLPFELTELGNYFFPHPRFWDIHFWRNDGGMPSTAIWCPEPVIGLGEEQGVTPRGLRQVSVLTSPTGPFSCTGHTGRSRSSPLSSASDSSRGPRRKLGRAAGANACPPRRSGRVWWRSCRRSSPGWPRRRMSRVWIRSSATARAASGRCRRNAMPCGLTPVESTPSIAGAIGAWGSGSVAWSSCAGPGSLATEREAWRHAESAPWATGTGSPSRRRIGSRRSATTPPGSRWSWRTSTASSWYRAPPTTVRAGSPWTT